MIQISHINFNNKYAEIFVRIIIVFSFEGQIVEENNDLHTHTHDGCVSRTFQQTTFMTLFLLLCSGANFHRFSCANVCRSLFICPFIRVLDHAALLSDVVVQQRAHAYIGCRCVECTRRWTADTLQAATPHITDGSHFIYRIKKLFSFLRHV